MAMAMRLVPAVPSVAVRCASPDLSLRYQLIRSILSYFSIHVSSMSFMYKFYVSYMFFVLYCIVIYMCVCVYVLWLKGLGS